MYKCYLIKKSELDNTFRTINIKREKIISCIYCDDGDIAIVTEQKEKVVY